MSTSDLDIEPDGLADTTPDFRDGFASGVEWAQCLTDSEVRRLREELRITQSELANLRQVREDERYYEEFMEAEEQ